MIPPIYLYILFHRLTPEATCYGRYRGSIFNILVPQAYACGYMLWPLSRLYFQYILFHRLTPVATCYGRYCGSIFNISCSTGLRLWLHAMAAIAALFSIYLVPQAYACGYMLWPLSRLITKRAKLEFPEEKFAHRVIFINQNDILNIRTGNNLFSSITSLVFTS